MNSSLFLSIIFVYWTIMSWFVLLRGVYPASRISSHDSERRSCLK